VIPLQLSSAHARQIEAEGVKAYPNECCGIIFGIDRDGQRIVQRLQSVVNAFDAAEQFHRFSISPQLLMAAEKEAADTRQLVLGFYHSHPDAPARPSEYDRERAWPFYSYVIVSIANRQPVDMTSWLLDEQTGSFQRQDIIEEGSEI
jgi:proteasome lid subunit RPN8/RPN11